MESRHERIVSEAPALSHDERERAIKALNLHPEIASSDEEIARAYYRFELAQKDFSKYPDISFEEWQRDNWLDSSKREEIYATYSPVGEKIRQSGARNKETAKTISESSTEKPKVPTNEEIRLERETLQAKQQPGNNRINRERDPQETAEARVLELIKSGKLERVVIHQQPDTDAQMAVHLLEIATGKKLRVIHVSKGHWVPGELHLDTGERPEGLSLEKDGSIFFDHHGMEKGSNTSASGETYKFLNKHGLIEEKDKKWTANFVKFINEIDNMSYDMDKKFYLETWWQTLYSAKNEAPFEEVLRFFKSNETFDPRKPIERELAEKIAINKTMLTREQVLGLAATGKEIKTLWDLFEYKRGAAESDIKEAEDAKNNMERGLDMVVGLKRDESGRMQEIRGKAKINGLHKDLGKVLFVVFNQEMQVVDGKNRYWEEPKIRNKETAYVLGYDTYIEYHERSNTYFLQSRKNLHDIYGSRFDNFEKMDSNISVKMIRGRMIISGIGEKRGKNINLKNLIFGLGLEK